MFDGEALGRQLVEQVRAFVDRAVDPIRKRLETIEQRAAPVSVTGAVIDRDGNLVLTHSDGSTKDLGQVTRDGKDGVDGLGFDDMAAEYDGERGIVLRFTRGDQTKEFAFTMPVIIDRGVWTEGKAYDAGDAVTWAGSVWIAQKDGITAKPDSGDGWRLSVKRGRDGKAGRNAEVKAKQPVQVP